MNEQAIKAYTVHLNAAIEKMAQPGDQKFLAQAALKLLEGFLINHSKMAQSMETIAQHLESQNPK